MPAHLEFPPPFEFLGLSFVVSNTSCFHLVALMHVPISILYIWVWKCVDTIWKSNINVLILFVTILHHGIVHSLL